MSTEMFEIILVGVLIPLVPAVVLYLVLPRSTISVAGPFKGFQVRLTGASAAYFVVFAAIGWVFYQRMISDYELWTLEGDIDAAPGDDIALSISPPRQEILYAGTGAQFKISQVPLPIRQTGLIPHLVVYKASKSQQPLAPETVPLEPAAFGGRQYTVIKDESSRTLRIKEKIMLTSPVATPYLAAGAADSSAVPPPLEALSR